MTKCKKRSVEINESKVDSEENEPEVEQVSLVINSPIRRNDLSSPVDELEATLSLPVIQIKEVHQNQLQEFRNRHALAAEHRMQITLRNIEERASTSTQLLANSNSQNVNEDGEHRNSRE